MDCHQSQNLKICPCTYPGCSRKGICCECLRHHLANKELPACLTARQAGYPSFEAGLLRRTGMLHVTSVKSMSEAVKLAKKSTRRGDIILLSPAAASFGLFKNEFERGEEFRKAVMEFKK